MLNFCINFLNKAAKLLLILYDFAVASLADAWIKITKRDVLDAMNMVASLADAWIKIGKESLEHGFEIVASLADAWIKILNFGYEPEHYLVASLADAWIKIALPDTLTPPDTCRIPRGCVD